MDSFNHPRLRTYCRAEDLSEDGCVALASEILRDAARAYIRTRRALERCPQDHDLRHDLANLRRWYYSDYYAVLSCGLLDPATTIHDLDAIATRRKQRCENTPT